MVNSPENPIPSDKPVNLYTRIRTTFKKLVEAARVENWPDPGLLLSVSLPKETCVALEELAEITEVKGSERFVKLVQDAVRTFEWIVEEQLYGKTIMSLSREDYECLINHSKNPNKIEALVGFITPGKEEKANKYFESWYSS